MNKKVIQGIALVAFITIATAALYYGGVFRKSSNGSGSESQRVAHKVEILKYSDYSCPHCKAFIPLEEHLKQEFGDMVDIEYRYFPLSSFPFSELAAYAAEAARRQGKFQEMSDMLFDHQEEWSRRNGREQIFGYAKEIGLDMDQFEADVESDDVHETVMRQKREGIRRTVNSTPTFFLDGQKLRQNPQSYEQFKAIVELYMYRSDD